MVRGARTTACCTCCRRGRIHQHSECPVHRLRVREDVRQFMLDQYKVGPGSCLAVVLAANSSLELREVILRPQIVINSLRRCLLHSLSLPHPRRETKRSADLCRVRCAAFRTSHRRGSTPLARKESARVANSAAAISVTSAALRSGRSRAGSVNTARRTSIGGSLQSAVAWFVRMVRLGLRPFKSRANCLINAVILCYLSKDCC